MNLEGMHNRLMGGENPSTKEAVQLLHLAIKLRTALEKIRNKAGSHTVSHPAVSLGVDDPGMAGIFATADQALNDKP